MNAPNAQTLIIEPSRGWVSLKLHDLWEYRELLYFLAWRDIKVRYKQTVLGAAWAIIQPFFTMLVFSIFLGRLAKVPSDGIPYPIFTYCALLPWTFFAGSLERAGNSLVGSSNLITKVYFPRLVIPLSATITGLLDFGIALLPFIAMMVFYGYIPTLLVLYLPIFSVMCICTSLGVGLWLSALNVTYRDFRYVIPFLIQFWLFASPVAYPASLVPEPWRLLYGLNPMVGVVEGFRWALLSKGSGPGPMLAVSVLVTIVLMITGAFYFRRMEKTFADIV